MKLKEQHNVTRNTIKYRVTNSELGESIEICANSVEELKAMRAELLQVIYSLPNFKGDHRNE